MNNIICLIFGHKTESPYSKYYCFRCKRAAPYSSHLANKNPQKGEDDEAI